MEKAKKSSLLIVVSAVLILVGVVGLISDLIGLAGGTAMAAVASEAAQAGEAEDALIAGAGFLIILSAMAIVQSLFDLIAGVIGLRGGLRKGSPRLCKVFAIILLALSVLCIALNIIGNIGAPTFVGTIFGSVIRLLLPVMYFIGTMEIQDKVKA